MPSVVSTATGSMNSPPSQSRWRVGRRTRLAARFGAEFSLETLAGRACRGAVRQRRGHCGVCGGTWPAGLGLARRRSRRGGTCAKSCWCSRNSGRASCPAPLLGAVAANLALAGQQSNAARALLEDLHQGKATIALALGAFDGDPAAGQARCAATRCRESRRSSKARRRRRISSSSPARPQASRWWQAARQA